MAKNEMLFVLAASYDSVDAALEDYEEVKRIYQEAGVGHEFDASVVARDGDGGTHVITKHEESTRHGLKWGLAVGALSAVLPGVGLIGGAAAGSAIGAAVGHVRGGIPDKDLKLLAEKLERGSAGLVVVYTAKMKADVLTAIREGEEAVLVTLDVDPVELDRLLGAEASPAV